MSLGKDQRDMDVNYIYNSSGAASLQVQEGYWDQSLGVEAGVQGKNSAIDLPNVVFFGPLK